MGPWFGRWPEASAEAAVGSRRLAPRLRKTPGGFRRGFRRLSEVSVEPWVLVSGSIRRLRARLREGFGGCRGKNPPAKD